MKHSVKTDQWKIVLFTLIFFVGFLVIWILLGDLNMLHLEYVIPRNGVLWRGVITSENKLNLLVHYSKYGLTLNEIEKNIGKNILIRNKLGNIFNPIILIYIFSGLFLSILLPIIFKKINIINYDTIPFTFSVSFSFSIYIFSGLIGYWDKDMSWLYLLRLLILMISAFISFFLMNKLVTIIFLKNGSIIGYVNELENEISLSNKNFKKNKKVKRKVIEYVEIEKKDD